MSERKYKIGLENGDNLIGRCRLRIMMCPEFLQALRRTQYRSGLGRLLHTLLPSLEPHAGPDVHRKVKAQSF